MTGNSASAALSNTVRVETMAKRVKSSLSLDTVNEAIVDALIEAKGIGQKIRRLRLKRSMGLVELGQEVGLSASFLSQLENGRVIPTLKNLARIALVFKKELSYFFQRREGKALSYFPGKRPYPLSGRGVPDIGQHECVGSGSPYRPLHRRFCPGHRGCGFPSSIFSQDSSWFM